MKKIKSLFLIALFALGTLTSLNAQSKLAHVNTTEIVELMPETKIAQADLEKLSKTYETELKSLQDAYVSKSTQYSNEAENTTDLVNKTRMEELQLMEQSMRQYQQQVQQDMQKQQMGKMEPITEKILAAINEVVDTMDLEYVLDSSPGSRSAIVYKGKDITEDVKKILGL